jgi:hypothetical protein
LSKQPGERRRPTQSVPLIRAFGDLRRL